MERSKTITCPKCKLKTLLKSKYGFACLDINCSYFISLVLKVEDIAVEERTAEYTTRLNSFIDKLAQEKGVSIRV